MTGFGGIGTHAANGRTQNCRQNALRELYELDFAITDVQMYIDVYPECGEAREYKDNLISAREEAVAAYERTYGALTMYSPTERNGGLLPWQYGYGESK